MRIFRVLVCCVAGASSIACDTFAVVCTSEARFGLIVTAVDSITNAPVSDALIWVRDGSFVDTLPVFDGMAQGALERPGRYDVHIEAPLYVPWSRLEVRVTEGACHVKPVALTAKLRPLS
jgi:hypothetical protein